MSKKVSAEVFGKLSRLKLGDAIHFKADVEGKTVDCVVVVLSGEASGEMILSECAATPSHVTDGNGRWVLCNTYGLVTEDVDAINWIQETIRVEIRGGLKEAEKYQDLISKMVVVAESVSEIEKELKSRNSSVPIYAHQFCSDMEVAHGDGPLTTTSMAAWMVEYLPELPKSVQVATIAMVMSNFCNGDWRKKEGFASDSQKPKSQNPNQDSPPRILQ